MPELPEVEIIRLGLAQKLTGRKIKTIEILNSKTFQGDPKKLQGKKVLNIWRKAKVLGINLSGGISLLFHLKMSGQLVMNGQQNNHTRAIFEFSHGSRLLFNDQRKFGWIRVMDDAQLTVAVFLNSLGPEPLDESFTWKTLKQNLLKRRSQPVKAAIMDQTVVAGIGNIYACESLFAAQIHPSKRVGELEDSQIKKLHSAIIKVLKAGIKYGGSSRTHFVNAQGKRGYFLDHAFVYRREGKKCKQCNFMIEKTRVAGRGTYFCPNCQDSVQ